MTGFDDDVKHSNHDHVLKPVNRETPYRCNGCKEIGWGLRFRCEKCDYDLHKDCALSTTQKSDLPFYRKHTFRFVSRTFAGTTCDACGYVIQGFAYVCPPKKINLHPCCANLRRILESGEVTLRLRKHVVPRCIRCCSRNILSQGWSYQSTCNNYHIHVSCIRDLVKKEVEEKWDHYFGGGGSTSVDVHDVLQIDTGSMKLWRDRSWPVASIVLNLVISIVLGNPLGVIDFFVCLASL